MEMVGNRSFTLTAGNGKWNRLRRLKNGVPQGRSWHSSSTSTFLTAKHRLQKVCICWRPSNHACWWRLADSGGSAEQQARRQDLAAGGPKTRRRGHKPEGGPHFKIQYWMYAATGGPTVKWGGTDFKWGAGHHCPPAGDDPAEQGHGNCRCIPPDLEAKFQNYKNGFGSHPS